MDVVAFYDVENKNGETNPGLWLQSHWALTGIQFDAAEAMMYAVQAVAAGTTFHFSVGSLNSVPAGNYQFTLNSPLPAGGQAMLVKSGTSWNITTYSSATSTEVIETVVCTTGTDGTDLGAIDNTTNSLMKVGITAAAIPSGATVLVNHSSITQYGYNRWSQSAIRQWLNSDAAAGAWWTPQNIFDRPPSQLDSVRGFMAGLDPEFLAVVRPVKVVTALNTVTDTSVGVSEVTYDRFFLPSLEQEYCVPQANGVEGAYWPYWKERLELENPQGSGDANKNPRHIRYAIENHSSAQYCRLRSAYRGYASHAWNVYAAGYVYNNYAAYANRPVPACVIC